MLWFYRFLSGFLKISVYGENKEKIISLCADNGITLWNSRFKDEKIETYISVKEFKVIRRVTNLKGARIHILSKRGLPFITERYKKRWGIPVGAVIFFLVLELMSSFIWVIDIEGNHKVTDETIIAACEEIGIKEGVKGNSFNPKIAREKLMLNLDSIAWSSLNVEGSRLTVNVNERRKEKEEKTYSNLKAQYDGIIEKMDIVSGNSVVKVGDAVKKGDLLVSGIIETADDTYFVNSKGTVTAKIKQTIVLKEDFTQKKTVPTGDIKTKYVAEFFTLKVPLYLGREETNHTSSKNVIKAQLFGKKLPIRLYKKRFEFCREMTVKYSYADLCAKLENRLKKETEKEKFKIISTKFSRDEKGVTLTAQVSGTKNICFEDILIINAGNHGENVVK